MANSGFTVQVDLSKFQQRVATYQQNLRHILTSEWQEIVRLCVDDVVSRTPQISEEYAFIMGYQGSMMEDIYDKKRGAYKDRGFRGTLGNRFSAIPRSGRSGNYKYGASLQGSPHTGGSSTLHQIYQRRGKYNTHYHNKQIPDQRISFIRSPGMWLEEVVEQVNVSDAGSYTIGLGNRQMLEEKTKFSWQNYSNNTGPHRHTSGYGVWSFFEEGKSHMVLPRGQYRLRRDYDQFWWMEKSYPNKGMYRNFNSQVFFNAVHSRIDQVKF